MMVERFGLGGEGAGLEQGDTRHDASISWNKRVFKRQDRVNGGWIRSNERVFDSDSANPGVGMIRIFSGAIDLH